MTERDQNFIDALACWHSELAHLDFLGWLTEHWICDEPTVLRHGSGQQGRLGAEALRTLKEVRETIADDQDPNFARYQATQFLQSLGIQAEGAAEQFVTLTSALLAGVAAAHHLSDWQPSANRHLPEQAIEPLTTCLRQYHSAWNLYTPPVQSIAGHAAATGTSDRATAALDRLHDSFNGDMPEWWSQSNWLLVRRLLSFLLGDENGAAVGDENRVQMLVVADDGNGGFRGLTAPVETAAYSEGWSSAYLDPAALGVTLLDQSMLDSLRIAARICRADLLRQQEVRTSQPLALRIAPHPGRTGLALLSGGSAGGLVTVAACATARGQRLNQNCTASFQVTVSDVSLLRDVNRALSIDDVQLLPVAADSIEAKLTSEDFRQAGLTTAMLHRTQTSKPRNREYGWEEWVPRVMRDHVLQIRPIDAQHTLADVIGVMTGDERLEQAVVDFAAAAARDWPAMLAGNTVRAEENHRLDTHVEPRLSVELRDDELRERRRTENEAGEAIRGGERSPSEQDRFEELDPGLDELIARYVRGEDSWVLITEQAGGGKTVLSWQLRHVLSSGPEPCLVVRYENTWPDHLRTSLEEAARRFCPHGVEPGEVIRHLAEQRRIVVIFDALDQVSDETAGLLTRLYRNESDPELAAPNLQVIVTSRPHAVNSWPDAFNRAHWRHFHLEPFNEQQQEQYLTAFADLRERRLSGDGQRARDLWETVTALQTDTDLLALPINLRHIREMIEDHLDLGEPLRPFLTAGDLRWETAWRALSRDPFKVQGRRRASGVVAKLIRAASCLAFEMLRQTGSYIVRGARQIEQVRKKAAERFGGTSEEWRQCDELLQQTFATGSAVLRRNNSEELSFPSLKSLEFFAGLFLAGYADEAALADLRPHIGDDRWHEAWKFAVEMTETTDSEGYPQYEEHVYQNSMNLLFAPPAGPHPRPTELMFRAWQVMKRNDFSRLEEILHGYRQQFLNVLAGNDLDRAQRAAELLWEDDLQRLVAEERTGRWSFDELRPDAVEHSAYALCSNSHDGNPDRLTFLMGASPEDGDADEDEKPWREVSIPSFRMATCCVTRDQYRLFDPHREQQHSEERWGLNRIAPDDDSPMTFVSWHDSFCFALWLGNAYRLPTEVQWEGAAWGGMDRKRHPERVIGVPPYDGSFTSEQVNYDGNYPLKKSSSLSRTLPVRWDASRRRRGLSGPAVEAVPGAYQANGFGMWQMSGNVWEWCMSEYYASLDELTANSDPQVERESADVSRLWRGGSCRLNDWFSRCSFRTGNVADDRIDDTGFRLARTE